MRGQRSSTPTRSSTRTSGRWISRAEVAEIDFIAFAAQPQREQVPGRLVVRRIPDFNADTRRAIGQDTLFDLWRFHAFFTTADAAILDTVTADRTHRGHAIIEQVHADLKNSALAHLPSGVFTANAAWLVLAVIAFNLTRAAGSLAAADLAKATTATVRRKLVQVPGRVATSARRVAIHSTPRLALGERLDTTVRPRRGPTSRRGSVLTTQPDNGTTQEPRGTARHRGRTINHAAEPKSSTMPPSTRPPTPSVDPG